MKIEKRSNKIALFLIFIGILICFIPNISKLIFEVKSCVLIENYEQTIENTSKIELKNKEVNENEQIIKEDMFDNKSTNIEKETDILGIINIPKINIKLPIFEGTDKKTLNRGIGHLENSSELTSSETSHTVLAGHSGLSTATMFNSLNELNIGDKFFIKTFEGILEYEVIEKNINLPNEYNLKIEENKNLVTLVTCTPIRKNTHRLLVTGKLTRKLSNEELEIEIDKKNSSYTKTIIKKIILLNKNIKLKWIIFIILIICVIIGNIKVFKRKGKRKDDLYNR